MAKMKYYHDDENGNTVEIVPESVHYDNGVKFGTPVTHKPTYDREAKKWDRGYVKVTRTIQYKSNPSKHECDARCMHAKGRTMNCECSCGGANHGKHA